MPQGEKGVSKQTTLSVVTKSMYFCMFTLTFIHFFILYFNSWHSPIIRVLKSMDLGSSEQVKLSDFTK